jgi:hypothetical protein
VRAHVTRELSEANALIVLIGLDWLAGEWTTRADNHHRMAIEVALNTGKPVIPVLLDDAAMPDEVDLPPELAPITRLDAHRLKENSFHADAAKLADMIAPYLQETHKTAADSDVPMPAAGHDFVRSVIDSMGELAGIAFIAAFLAALAGVLDIAYLIQNADRIYGEGDTLTYSLVLAILYSAPVYAIGYGLSLIVSIKRGTVFVVVGGLAALTVIQMLVIDINDPSTIETWAFRAANAAVIAFCFSTFNMLTRAEGEMRLDANQALVVLGGLIAIAFVAAELGGELFETATNSDQLRVYGAIIAAAQYAAISALLVQAFIVRRGQLAGLSPATD